MIEPVRRGRALSLTRPLALLALFLLLANIKFAPGTMLHGAFGQRIKGEM